MSVSQQAISIEKAVEECSFMPSRQRYYRYFIVIGHGCKDESF